MSHSAAFKMAKDQFWQRHKRAKELPPIENDKLQAGQPMYSYCLYCHTLCDVVDELFLFPPYNVCSQCEGIVKQGWMKDVQIPGEEMFYD